MQDRFKFRIFDKEQKKVITLPRHFNFSIINGTVLLLESYPTSAGFYNKRIVKEYDDAILIQCSGLKDKNGKLIYDGDILKFKLLEDFAAFGTNEKYVEIIAPVIYEYGGFFIEQSENNIFLGQLPRSEIEVVGNIYENPELLEDK